MKKTIQQLMDEAVEYKGFHPLRVTEGIDKILELGLQGENVKLL